MLVWSQVCAPQTQYRNLSCLNEATNYFCHDKILVGSNGGYGLDLQEHPIVDKHLHLDHFQSFDYGMFRLEWIYHGFLGKTGSCISSSTGEPKNIPCLPAFYHIDVREVVFSWWRTPELKEGPSYTWWIADSPLFLHARSARTCNRRCQCSSMIGILCTAFWVPCRAIHIIRCSQHPESFVLTRDWKGLNDWFCCRSCWRACRFGRFSIFWINCRTMVLCACFTTECGSPGIMKSMSASFTIIGSWFSSWTTMDFSILLRSTSSSTLSVSASCHTWESSCTAAVFATGRPVLSWVCSTLRLMLSSDERVWITSVSTNRPVLSEELSSSLEEFTLISWEKDVFLSSCMSSSRPDLSRIGFGVGCVDWKNLVCRTTSPPGCWTTFEPNSLVHSWCSEIFGGNRSDMHTFRFRVLQFSV